MNKIKVSIILPTYNGAKFISGAIKSVSAQSYKDWELLVIDDGSTDKTAEIVEELSKKDSRIKYFRNEKNLGIQKTLNKGLKLARGEYVARIDDDDRWVDVDKLKKQVEFLDKNPDYILVGMGVIVVNEDGDELFRFLNPQTDEDIRKKILSRNCFTHSSVMFRKEVAINLGGYSESEDVKHIEDYDLWLKFGRNGKMANLPMHAIHFIMRDKSISSKNKNIQLRRNIKIAKKYRKFYPNYFKASAKNYLRLFMYGVFKFIPFLKLKASILRKYKES